MAEAQWIEPDREVVKSLIAAGGESLKNCFQCGTCTVVCKLSPDSETFPRREMIWAQWGLKDRLLADPNIWMCHQCTDCSVHCPRGAKPGDVFSALRNMAIQHYSPPSFMGKFISDQKYLAAFFAVPAILLLVILAVTGKLGLPEGEVEFAKMYSHAVLITFYTGLTLAAGLAFAIGVIRMWGAWDKSFPAFDTGNPIGMTTGIISYISENFGNLLSAVITEVKKLLFHERFKECEANRTRYWAHLMVFYGFIGLLITTFLAIVVLVFHDFLASDTLGVYPLKLYHPIKYIGNLSGLALIIGALIMIWNRQTSADADEMRSSYFDWLLIFILLVVAITGILAQSFRFLDIPVAAYPTYFVHLVCVFTLLIYSPWSKFAHFIYRIFALIFLEFRRLKEAPESTEETGGEAAEKAA